MRYPSDSQFHLVAQTEAKTVDIQHMIVFDHEGHIVAPEAEVAVRTDGEESTLWHIRSVHNAGYQVSLVIRTGLAYLLSEQGSVDGQAATDFEINPHLFRGVGETATSNLLQNLEAEVSS